MSKQNENCDLTDTCQECGKQYVGPNHKCKEDEPDVTITATKCPWCEQQPLHDIADEEISAWCSTYDGDITDLEAAKMAIISTLKANSQIMDELNQLRETTEKKESKYKEELLALRQLISQLNEQIGEANTAVCPLKGQLREARGQALWAIEKEKIVNLVSQLTEVLHD